MPASKAEDKAMGKAERNWYLLQRADTPRRQVWLNDLYEGDRYYEDIQLTTEEKQELKDAGMPYFTTNRMTAVIDVMKYFITANAPRWKATGWTGDDTSMSDIFDALFEFCFQLSDGDMKVGQIVLNALTKSLGFFLIYADTEADRGMGETLIDSIPPDTVYVDPTCRDLMFRDAAFIIVGKNVTKEWLKNQFPQYKQQIEKASGNPLTTASADSAKPSRNEEVSEDAINSYSGENEDVIPLIETYKKFKVQFYNLFIHNVPDPEEVAMVQEEGAVALDELQAELSIQLEEAKVEFEAQVAQGQMLESRAKFELQKMMRAHKAQLQQQVQLLASKIQQMQSSIVNKIIRVSEYDKLIKSGAIKEDDILDKVPFYDDRVMKEVSVGTDTLLFDEDTDYRYYPIIPLPFMFNGKPYPISAAKPMVGKQQQINKADQITIHHATLSSNSPWLIQDGTISNEDDWDLNVAMPGGRLTYEYAGPDSKPERQKPEPLNNAFFSIAQQGKEDLEYIAGVPSSLMGLADNPSETFRGKMANDEFSTRRLKSWIKTVFEPVLSHVGKVFLDVSQHVYKVHKVFRLIDEAGFKEYEINIPMYDDKGEIVGKMFDYETLNYDIRVVASSTMPSNKEAEEGRWLEMFEKGLIDDIEMYKHIQGLGDKEGLIQRNSTYSKLSGQIESLEQEVKRLTGDLQTAQRARVQAEIKNDVLLGGLESKKDVLETEAQQKTLRGAMKNEFSAFRKEMALIIKDAVAQKNTKTEAPKDKKE